MKHLIRNLATLSALAISSVACGGPQDDFTQDRIANACNSTVPVCSTTAGCVLDNTSYTSGSFAQGATRRFIVRTTSAAKIEVELFFVSEGTPGTDTEADWFETGCTAEQSLDSGGTDVFAEAGPSRIWSRTAQVASPGDHLVQVFSDAQADYLLRVIVTPAQ